MSILISIAVSIATVLISAWGVYNFMPLGAFDVLDVGIRGKQPSALATSTIAATDTLRDSRSVINDNFLYLDRYRIANATSSLPLITTLSGLVSVGTLTTGTWNASTIGVAYGGTGSTTLAANLILLGNGTGAVSVVNGTGAANQFLQSQGAGLPPIWVTSLADQTTNYAWTGRHNFQAQFGVGTATPSTGSAGIQNNLNVTGTVYTAGLVATGTIRLNGVDYTFPSAQATQTNSSLINRGDGNLLWKQGSHLLTASTTQVTTAADTAENATNGLLISANTLGANDGIRITAGLVMSPGTGNRTWRIRLDDTQVCSIIHDTAGSAFARFQAEIFNRNSLTSQFGFCQFVEDANNTTRGAQGTAAENTGTALQLKITCVKATGADTCGTDYFSVEILRSP